MFAANPRAFVLKKWFEPLLQDRLTKHEAVIERLSTALVTESDLAEFSSLISDIHGTGYRSAVMDYKSEFERLGVCVSVVDVSPASSAKDGENSEGQPVRR